MQTRSTFITDRRRSRRRAAPGSKRRRATATLELVLVLPMVVILILATIQFGLFYSNMQQVALASRVGAEEASQTPGLAATVEGGAVPANVLEAISKQLFGSGIRYCRVTLEHNVGGTQVALVSPQTGACDCGPTCKLSSPIPPGEYVRVSVCVRHCDLMPNSLNLIGYDTTDPSKVACSTTIFRHERTP